MVTIHKFVVPAFTPGALLLGDHFVSMPQYANVLSVGEQDDQLVAWARVDTEHPMVNVRFAICGTGHDASFARFVGTVQRSTTRLVAHVFVEGA